MTIIGQLLWLCLLLFCLMIEDFAFVLMYHGETSQLICSADHLSGFYLVHSIVRDIVSVLFLYLTWYYIPAQGCTQLFLFKDAG